jgi:hypothetical protein
MRCLVVVLLVGCAAPAPAPAPQPQPQPQSRWQNTLGSGTPLQFDRDAAECEQLALNAADARVGRGQQIFGPCMRGRGWRLVDR